MRKIVKCTPVVPHHFFTSMARRPFAPGDQNNHKITCLRCNCLFLNPGKGVFTVIENSQLPVIDSANSSDPNQVESDDFWLVDDIYSFENMTFSRNVDHTKYLACPECELGPLGFHDINSNKSYISLDRVGRTE